MASMHSSWPVSVCCCTTHLSNSVGVQRSVIWPNVSVSLVKNTDQMLRMRLSVVKSAFTAVGCLEDEEMSRMMEVV